MAVSKDFAEYVVEQLAGMRRVESRRMFGGVGLYADGLFFALIDDDTLYMKVDDGNRADYIERGLKPFQPFDDRPQYSMSYYAIPAELLEDPDELTLWARKSLAAASRAGVRQSGKRSKKKRS